MNLAKAVLFISMATPSLAYSFLGLGKRDDSFVYTLYRNSALDTNLRIHVATFDAEPNSKKKDNDEYNKLNCEDSAKLRMQQPGVRTKFWCEKGFFKE